MGFGVGSCRILQRTPLLNYVDILDLPIVIVVHFQANFTGDRLVEIVVANRLK